MDLLFQTQLLKNQLTTGKLAEQEGPELTSSRGHTKATTACDVTQSENDLKMGTKTSHS